MKPPTADTSSRSVASSTPGTAVDELDESTETALHVAAGCGHTDLVRLLLEPGAKSTRPTAMSFEPR